MNFDIRQGDSLDVLREMPDASVDCCVTSPPYFGLRDYGMAGQIGLEKTPAEFIERLVAVFSEVRRVLTAGGTCWVNIGDSYASTWSCGRKNAVGDGACDYGRRSIRTGDGIKEKDLIGIPWMLAFALRSDGWYLRQDIIWSKPNPMPESVKDRCTKSHEYVFMLTSSSRYFYDPSAIAEKATNTDLKKFIDAGPDKQRGHSRRHVGFSGRYANTLAKTGVPETRNKRSVWSIATQATPEAHFATFPLELPETCILAGCPEGGVVLDPFAGAGTTGLAAIKHGRSFIGIELNPAYVEIALSRAGKHAPLLAGVA